VGKHHGRFQRGRRRRRCGRLAAAAGRATPHEKAAEHIRKHTSRRVRFRPRTRAILVFVGAILIIVSWHPGARSSQDPGQGMGTGPDRHPLQVITYALFNG